MCGDFFCTLDLGHHNGFRGPASCHANNVVGAMPSDQSFAGNVSRHLTREAQRDLLEPLQPAGSNGETYRALSPDPAELSGAVDKPISCSICRFAHEQRTSRHQAGLWSSAVAKRIWHKHLSQL